MKANLYKNGIVIRQNADYPDLEMKLIDFRIKVNNELIENPDNFEWKLLIEGVKPTITILERLVRMEVDNDISNADYPHLKQIDIVWTAVRKSDAQITAMIEHAEDNANRNLVDKIKYLALYMGIVNRKVNNDNITPKMQSLLDMVDAKLVKLWQNDTNLKTKLQELADGQDPDINTGWTNE